eukprot:m.342852 g.342852  ORF g.342852 m.342852 type:complete len:224 (+) comp21915_c0_seq1:125-796(+)
MAEALPEWDPMSTTSSLSYRSPGQVTPHNKRPSSATRKHNPHCSKVFKVEQLPNGHSVHLSMGPTDRPSTSDSWNTRRRPVFEHIRELPTGASTQRSDYGRPHTSHMSFSGRYGNMQTPWGRKNSAPGVVPVMPRTRSYSTSSQESFRAPFPILEAINRTPEPITEEEQEAMQLLISDDGKEHLDLWMQEAPREEVEIIRKYLLEVGLQLRDASFTSEEEPKN